MRYLIQTLTNNTWLSHPSLTKREAQILFMRAELYHTPVRAFIIHQDGTTVEQTGEFRSCLDQR